MFIFQVYHMKETGWTKVSMDDVKDLHEKYSTAKK